MEKMKLTHDELIAFAWYNILPCEMKTPWYIATFESRRLHPLQGGDELPNGHDILLILTRYDTINYGWISMHREE